MDKEVTIVTINFTYINGLLFMNHETNFSLWCLQIKDNKLQDTQTCRNRQTWRVCCSWFLHVKSKLISTLDLDSSRVLSRLSRKISFYDGEEMFFPPTPRQSWVDSCRISPWWRARTLCQTPPSLRLLLAISCRTSWRSWVHFQHQVQWLALELLEN